MNIFDQYIQKLEYYPSQLDLDKNIFRFYKQQEHATQFLAIYENTYVEPKLFNHEDLIQFLQSEPFNYRKIPIQILQQKAEFELNVLNVFKIYVMIQDHLKQKVVFSDRILSTYQHLDEFFSELKKQPLAMDSRVNKRELFFDKQIAQVHKENNIVPIVIMLCCSLIALYLTLFTSSTLSLVVQAILYGVSFLIAKMMIPQSTDSGLDKNSEIQNSYLIKLDAFFENEMLKQKNSP